MKPLAPAGSGTPSWMSIIRTSSSRQAAFGMIDGGAMAWHPEQRACASSAVAVSFAGALWPGCAAAASVGVERVARTAASRQAGAITPRAIREPICAAVYQLT